MAADPKKGAAFVDAKRVELEKLAARPSTVSPLARKDELLRIYREGLGRGDSTGWPSVDRLLSIAPGQLTTVTGYPNSGKSQWLDSLSLNLARRGWRFVFCSLENIPIELHVEKILKQFVGKPVREGVTPRMSEEEAIEAMTEIDEWFSFVQPHELKLNPSLADVLEVIEADFQKRGLWGSRENKIACVIDPWNELEHVRPYGLSLTEYIGESLSMLRQWVRRHHLHAFLVAHPAKQQRDRSTALLPLVTPEMISDSAHFWNKSDNCVTVALPPPAGMGEQGKHAPDEVDIHVQKVRFAHIGMRGAATLRFDKVTGRYLEIIKAVEGARMPYADQ